MEYLDVLYFYEKVKMKNNKKNRFLYLKEEEEEYEEDENLKTLKKPLTNGEFIWINDIKFKSLFYIKVRQAFIWFEDSIIY